MAELEKVAWNVSKFNGPLHPIANISNEHFKKHKTKHHATVTTEDDIKELLLTLENYKGRGTYQIAEALNLTPYLLLRPGV